MYECLREGVPTGVYHLKHDVLSHQTHWRDKILVDGAYLDCTHRDEGLVDADTLRCFLEKHKGETVRLCVIRKK